MNMASSPTLQSPRLQAKRQARIEGILATATDMVARHGVDGLTIQGLAGELNYALGTLYQYFPSREALLVRMEHDALCACLATLQSRLDHLDTFLETHHPDTGPTARSLSRVLALIGAFEDFTLRHPGRFHLLNSLIADPRRLIPDEHLPSVVPTITDLLDLVAQALDTAARHEALSQGPAPERALHLWSAFHGLAQTRAVAERLALPASDLSMDLATPLLLGWGAPPGTLAQAMALFDAWQQDVPLLRFTPHPTQGDTP